MESGPVSGSGGDFAVILPAAGRSLRYGGGSKLAERLGDTTVLGLAAAAFLGRADVRQVVVATNDVDGAQTLLPRDGRIVFAPGGATRAESVRAALDRVGHEVEFVAVHDAARPLVSPALIDRVFAMVRERGAAGPATAVVQTVKVAQGPLPAVVEQTLARSTLWAMQTPQGMRTADLRRAFERCPVPWDQVTDDLQLLELAGMMSVLVAGEESNLKLTFPQDLELARHYLGLS